MNVIGYIRVSTDNQCKEDKFGLTVQKQQIEEYCAAHEMTITQWVADEGESGAKTRPGFDEIVYGEVSNPPVEAVVVAKTDRVARDINVYFYYKMLLRNKRIELVSVAEDFGAFGVFAPMLESFTLCVAQMERDNINKRTSAGRKAKASEGGYSGGKPPYGYKADNHQLVVIPEEAEVVRRIFAAVDAGESMLSVANLLNEDGVPSRSGGKWYVSTLKGILQNRRLYEGEYKYGDGEWREGLHEPILKKEGAEEK